MTDTDGRGTGKRQNPGVRRARAPSLESLYLVVLVLFGFRLGAHAIGDNSMFVHLRTGIDMARTGAIPRRDPYSFTAHGHPWVVQSWLPDWTYGWTHRLGGMPLVVLEQAVLVGSVALLVGRLARAGTPLRTALSATLAVGIGAPYWSSRPLLFGLVAMALTVAVVEGRRSPWLLVPIMWVWVNAHGSFVLAVAWLGARAAGEALDRRGWPRDSGRYAGGLVAGLVVSMANPLGPRLLTFPLAVADKRAIFKTILEWRSPDFQTAAGTFTLVCLLGALLVLLRRGAPWRDVVPVVLFLGLGVVAQRNLPLAAIVVAPALGRALRPAGTTGPSGTGVGVAVERPVLNLGIGAALALVAVSMVTGVLSEPGLNLAGYPVAAVTYVQQTGLRAPQHRIAQQDVVGCYLDLRYGRAARVFIDDRYDMFPISVSTDYQHLLQGNEAGLRALDRRHIDVVLWERSQSLVAALRASGRWRQVFADKQWVVLQRA
jgi:hypothetical protein